MDTKIEKVLATSRRIMDAVERSNTTNVQFLEDVLTHMDNVTDVLHEVHAAIPRSAPYPHGHTPMGTPGVSVRRTLLSSQAFVMQTEQQDD